MPSVEFGGRVDWIELARWVDAEDGGVEAGPGAVSMGERSRSGLVGRATSWPDPGRTKGPRGGTMKSTRGLTEGREARHRKTMPFLCGFAPWREIFHRGVRRSSNHWFRLTQGREARQSKNMPFLCGFAPLREVFLRRGVRCSSYRWVKGSREGTKTQKYDHAFPCALA